MHSPQWMIYGATGYSGKLIAEEAVALGLKPVIAGRNPDKVAALGKQLNCPTAAFSLDDQAHIESQIKDMQLVLHCAGPFSATARPMIEACLKTQTHYLDITGEIEIFEYAHKQNARAQNAGVILCPGVGFDVIPTDCMAASLKQAMPDATELALGFDSRSGFSPGTAKTSVEGLAMGGRVRRNAALEPVPLAYKTRKIDFGNGEKLAMTIPWGDVSTAYYSTQIRNIEVYIPASPKLVSRLKWMNWIRPLLGLGPIQSYMKSQVDKKVKGPDEAQREKLITYVWGEVKNSAGKVKRGQLVTANGYEVTKTGAVRMAKALLEGDFESGAMTPSMLMGPSFVETLPDCGKITIEDA